jgi:hypothetical protein
MIQTKELDTNLLEAEFYNKPFKFSYSSLNKLLTAPTIFYKDYVLKQREETHAKHLLAGTIIHYLVLENQGFDDQFIVSSEDLPSPTNMTVADEMFKLYLELDDENLQLCDFEDQILEQLKAINKHQSLKDTKDGTGDGKRMAKIVEPKTEAYFTFLKDKQGRTIIDSALLDKSTRRADIVKTDSHTRELLGLDIVSDGKTFGVYNELELTCDAEENMPFGFKGILDNMVIDVHNKTVRINDFKTTGKPLMQFEESVDYWNYWLQAAMYMKLVRNYLKKVLTDEWSIEFRFIVFDKHDHLYAFPVSPETMEAWEVKLQDAVKEAQYHYESKDFTLPYNYAQGNVKL